LVVALIAGTTLLYSASVFQYHGYFWADRLCQAAPALCAALGWLGDRRRGRFLFLQGEPEFLTAQERCRPVES
jgi:hypothetical protein